MLMMYRRKPVVATTNGFDKENPAPCLNHVTMLHSCSWMLIGFRRVSQAFTNVHKSLNKVITYIHGLLCQHMCCLNRHRQDVEDYAANYSVFFLAPKGSPAPTAIGAAKICF